MGKKKYLSIELLNSLSKKEIEGFSNFISYHYFNSNKSVVKLLGQLCKHVIGKQVYFSDQEVKIYRNVFSDLGNAATLNIKQRKRLNSKLNAITRLVENFLCINALEENIYYQNELLYKILLKKKQYELFNRKINLERKRLAKVKLKDSLYYYQANKTEEYVLISYYQNDLLVIKDNLEEQNKYIDLHYILKKMSIYVSMLSNELASKRNYDYTSMEFFLELANHTDYNNIPLVSAYKATIFLLKNQTEAAYQKLVKLLDKFNNQLDDKILIYLYNIVLNFCATQLSKEKFTFYDLFEIYKKLDEQNLLLEENFMPNNKLKNVLTIGCRIGNFQWAKSILTKYYPFIRKPVRESVHNFNLGAIAFYQKKFDDALKHFIKVDKVSLTYDINCRLMMLKAHYEIDDYYDERTVQIYRSAEKYFVENKSLTVQDKRAFKNFIRMLINLYRIKHKETKMNAENFNKKLAAQENNSDKSWLKEKLSEIKN